jgi:hypothetical protein
MPAGTSLVASPSRIGTSVASTLASQGVQELNSLAVRGLVSMFDPEKKLFCYRVRRTPQGLIREGHSHRYTVMALLGLHALQKSGAPCPIAIDVVFESCVSDTRWIGGVGDLGLLIWLTAEYAPDQLDGLFQRVGLETCLDRFQDAREARTMELAWFLTGLCHAAIASPQGRWPLDDLAVETYHRLQDNRDESSLFGHLGRRNSWKGLVRGRIGTFADQIYPIYALSKFATAFNLEEPLESAMECASVICRLQGNLGQWWWFYDSATGRVACRYPVYSVDQHGMAPLALFALEQATGQPFQDYIYRGLGWIYGSNELGEDLRSASGELIWRCIVPKRNQRRYWDTVLSFIRTPKEYASVRSLHVLHESRPFELGLLLYSFAKFGMAKI